MGLLQPAAAKELALLEPADTRIVLDLRRRKLAVVRAGQRWGPWPVAIGDPQTPTPQGTFSILSKQINPVYLSTKGGKPRKLVGPTSPIGDRYLGFHRGDRVEFGIHGTPWPHCRRELATCGRAGRVERLSRLRARRRSQSRTGSSRVSHWCRRATRWTWSRRRLRWARGSGGGR